MKKIIVTSALPYANGPIHFGHIAGAYLPADIFVRFMKQQGHDVIYICGTDEHGVAITISAKKAGITPQEQVDKYHKTIKTIFDKFNIKFDNFSRTTNIDHYRLSQKFFIELYKNKLIKIKKTKQFYCKNCNMYLADRYIYGECPDCGYALARGDECPSCGKWLEAIELKNPKCKICHSTPEIRETEHFFLDLPALEQDVKEWFNKRQWKDNVKNFVNGWFKKGLKERAISRDMEWGVPIPYRDEDGKKLDGLSEENVKGKVLYVWFDAPIGYISSTIEWAAKIGKPEEWKKYWQDRDTRLINFIGKDNIPFHCVVFPAMTLGQSTYYKTADEVPANEFYNLQGRQFSKSEGWYIDPLVFLDKYNTDSIRYTIAANCPETKDSEFTWEDYKIRNNSELADILGNFINRVLRFTKSNFNGKIPAAKQPEKIDEELINTVRLCMNEAFKSIANYKYRKYSYNLIDMARAGNKYFDEKKPWFDIKDAKRKDRAAITINYCLNVIKMIAPVAYPLIPKSAEKIWSIFEFSDNISTINWNNIDKYELKPEKSIKIIDILFKKIDDKIIEEEIGKMEDQANKSKIIVEKTAEKNKNSIKREIEYEDFAKLDIRTAKILSAERVKNSKKLIKLNISIGIEERTLVAGIGKQYEPTELIGRTIIVLANLKPRKLMGIESQGMLLAATCDNTLALLTTQKNINPGASIS